MKYLSAPYQLRRSYASDMEIHTVLSSMVTELLLSKVGTIPVYSLTFKRPIINGCHFSSRHAYR